MIGKHSCMSSLFPITKLKGTCCFSNTRWSILTPKIRMAKTNFLNILFHRCLWWFCCRFSRFVCRLFVAFTLKWGTRGWAGSSHFQPRRCWDTLLRLTTNSCSNCCQELTNSCCYHPPGLQNFPRSPKFDMNYKISITSYYLQLTLYFLVRVYIGIWTRLFNFDHWFNYRSFIGIFIYRVFNPARVRIRSVRVLSRVTSFRVILTPMIQAMLGLRCRR